MAKNPRRIRIRLRMQTPILCRLSALVARTGLPCFFVFHTALPRFRFQRLIMMQSWHIAPPCCWYRKIGFAFPSVNRNEQGIFILQKEKILKIFEDRKKPLSHICENGSKAL